MTRVLEVSGLCVGYGREDVLRDVSFAMAEGEFVCVLGANGCGKTPCSRPSWGY